MSEFKIFIAKRVSEIKNQIADLEVRKETSTRKMYIDRQIRSLVDVLHSNVKILEKLESKNRYH